MSDNQTYRDWIPEGEDTGAITKDGFQDYVPPVEPKPQVIEEIQEPVLQQEQVPEPQIEEPALPQPEPPIQDAEVVEEVVPEGPRKIAAVVDGIPYDVNGFPIVGQQIDSVLPQQESVVPPLEPQQPGEVMNG